MINAKAQRKSRAFCLSLCSPCLWW